MSQTPEFEAPSSARVSPPPFASGITLRVRAGDGQVTRVIVHARSEQEALRKAGARGLQVLGIEASAAARREQTMLSRRSRRFPLMLFSQELLALLESGLNVTEALATLIAKERHAATRQILQRLLEELQEGRSFSDVLERNEQHFPAVYVATVRAAERTGDLPDALSRFVAYQMQFEAVRKRLVSALIYPTLLLLVGGFVTLFLLGYVVPRFSTMYEATGREMPWLSARLLDFGHFINANLMATIAAVAGALALVVATLAQPQGRAWLLDGLLRLPWLATKAAEFRLARFFRALSLLLASGIPIARALGMVGGLLGVSQRAALEQVRRAVDEGMSLSAALHDAGLSNPVADSLIKVGERSGQLALMLERTAKFNDEAFGRWLDWFSRLIEPVMMMLIGGVIGTVVVLMYMPIFELAGTLQ